MQSCNYGLCFVFMNVITARITLWVGLTTGYVINSFDLRKVGYQRIAPWLSCACYHNVLSNTPLSLTKGCVFLREHYQRTDNLAGGSYSGLINFFDLRKSGATVLLRDYLRGYDDTPEVFDLTRFLQSCNLCCVWFREHYRNRARTTLWAGLTTG